VWKRLPLSLCLDLKAILAQMVAMAPMEMMVQMAKTEPMAIHWYLRP
jgi:hypothetical protein